MTLRGLVVGAGLLVSANGLGTPGFPGAVAGPGYLAVPVSSQRRHIEGLRRRADAAGTSNVELDNFKSQGYAIDLSIGTPPQTVEVIFDTGSQELWVNPDCSTASRANITTTNGQPTIILDGPSTDPELCRKRTRYDQSRSSTSKTTNLTDSQTEYIDGAAVTYSYVRDKISIGGLSINDQVFGVAKSSTKVGIGIMGMGPHPLGYNNQTGLRYPLILSTMAQQEVIKSPAFSLNLKGLDSQSGTVIFGGVDKKKYTGSLAKIPFTSQELKLRTGQTVKYFNYFVKVNSVKVTAPQSSTPTTIDVGQGFVATLDSGSGANLLPQKLGTDICRALNGTASRGVCILPCDLRKQPGGVTFGLDGKDIQVTYDNLISEDGVGAINTCMLLIVPGEFAGTNILGAPFLRSSFAVFDWANENLHIAQAADCGSNIVAIGSGRDAVPTGDGECSSASSPGSSSSDKSPGARSVVDFSLVLGSVVLCGLVLLL